MIFFIIPAYNEEKNLPYLLESTREKMDCLKLPYKMIIVNDGSTDGTKKIAESRMKQYPITLLNHDTNMNVGQVFRTAFHHILKEAGPGDVIVTKEADNTSDLGILEEMLKKIDSGYDMVLASCYAKGGKITGTTIDRIILSSVANLLLRISFPMKGIRTYSSFYRAYKYESIKKAFDHYGDKFIEEDGFVSTVEMLIKMNRLGIVMTEVPMVLRCDFRKGSSKMNKSQTMLAYFRIIAKEFGKRNTEKA